MSGLTEVKITNSYNKIKRLAQSAFNHADYERSLALVEVAAKVAYNFNFIYKDDSLEDLLYQISTAVIKNTTFRQKPRRIVFYDFFGLGNRGLTQQYIRALIQLNCEFLYILENYVEQSDGIISELREYEKVKIVIVDSGLSRLEKIKFLNNEIIDYAPKIALLHLHPASVIAVTIFNALASIERYQINLTDHAFWLGVNCIDYSLEFRDYGCNVSTQQRGLPLKKILMQPYYPITDCATFKGLPYISNDQVVIFTGGTYYKMYGDNNSFFEILKRLLDENPKVVLLLAGDGDAAPLKRFIISNNYEKRLLLIGNRPDVNFIFQKCDIYLSTYPITGGLMSQFAAVNEKPILSYSSIDIPCNDVGSFLSYGPFNELKITQHDLDIFLDNAKNLINDKDKRAAYGKQLKTRVIDDKNFNELLSRNIFGEKEIYNFSEIQIDYRRFSNLYLEVENRFLPTFRKLMVYNFKLSILFLFPELTFNLKTFLILIKSMREKMLKV